MDELHITIWSVNSNDRKLVSKLRENTYIRYISSFDPTRLNDDFITQMKTYLKDIRNFHKLCEKISKRVLSSDSYLIPAIISDGLGGSVQFDNSTYLLTFSNLPIHAIDGITWKFYVPITTNFDEKCTTRKDI